jgi:tRNA threonylcarbamoyl adenosine modification protein YeaZ
MAVLERADDGTGRLLASVAVVSGKAQSRLLAASVADMLEELGLTVGGLDVVAVSHGPGSFTGVRVGLSLAKGLCLPPGGPRLVTVSSLEALAWHAYSGEDVAAVVAMHDALRGEVYARMVSVSNRGLTTGNDKDEVLTIDALMERWPGRALVAGEGALLHREALVARLGDRVVWPRPDRALPDARTVALIGGMLAAEGKVADVLKVGPLYLRDATVKVKQR